MRSSSDRFLSDIAHCLGIHLETLHTWVRDNKSHIQTAGVTSA
ncbi:hypothetical protein [Streptomyces sp. NPDC057257]